MHIRRDSFTGVMRHWNDLPSMEVFKESLTVALSAVVFGRRLDSMIPEVFSGQTDSVIPWKLKTNLLCSKLLVHHIRGASKQLERVSLSYSLGV